MQIGVAEVGLQRKVEQVAGLLELQLIERFDPLGSQLTRGIRQLVLVNAGGQLSIRCVESQRSECVR